MNGIESRLRLALAAAQMVVWDVVASAKHDRGDLDVDRLDRLLRNALAGTYGGGTFFEHERHAIAAALSVREAWLFDGEGERELPVVVTVPALPDVPVPPLPPWPPTPPEAQTVGERLYTALGGRPIEALAARLAADGAFSGTLLQATFDDDRSPRLDELFTLATALGCRWQWLATGEGDVEARSEIDAATELFCVTSDQNTGAATFASRDLAVSHAIELWGACHARIALHHYTRTSSKALDVYGELFDIAPGETGEGG